MSAQDTTQADAVGASSELRLITLAATLTDGGLQEAIDGSWTAIHHTDNTEGPRS